MNEIAVPRTLTLLWGGRMAGEPSRPGPKAALSLSSVVAAAVELVDAEGLAQLSMSRLAERLGYTTMSVYRYVKSKDELIALMLDAASPDPPEPRPDDWRSAMVDWARAMFHGSRQRPWMLQVPITGPPIGPRQLWWMETGVANLAQTGLTEAQKLQFIQLLHGYVRGQAQFAAELLAAKPQMPYEHLLRHVITAESHPALWALVESGTFDPAHAAYDERVDFEFGLDRILDGVSLLIG